MRITLAYTQKFGLNTQFVGIFYATCLFYFIKRKLLLYKHQKPKTADLNMLYNILEFVRGFNCW